MSSELDKLIEKLPEEYQALARRYANLMLNWAVEDIDGWTELIAQGNWQPAYEMLIDKLSTSELLAEHRRINARLTQLNQQNAEHIALQKEMIREALLIALMIVKAKIE